MIVAHDVSLRAQTQTGKHLLRTQKFLNKIRHIFSSGTKFLSATNVARAGKRGNICVGNNVSATMCPRLPGPYESSYTNIFLIGSVSERVTSHLGANFVTVGFLRR